MCTVTFIPFADTYYITSNRDESPLRKSKGLTSVHPPDKHVVHFPLDEESGGSWIAMADSGKVGCLLNGAFEPFISNPPYRQSRGRVVLDAVMELDTEAFLAYYHLDGIAPFTLLLYEDKKFIQVIWDGAEKIVSALALTPQIWSSVTLYPEHVRKARKDLFDQWISRQQSISRESIISFHQMQPGDPVNDFVMNRNEIVKTLSITSVALHPTSASLLHYDLDNNMQEEIRVKYG